MLANFNDFPSSVRSVHIQLYYGWPGVILFKYHIESESESESGPGRNDALKNL